MSKTRTARGAVSKEAPAEILRLCEKVADQGSKGLWWNALAAATDLVRACQEECRAEVERVVAMRATPKKRSKKK